LVRITYSREMSTGDDEGPPAAGAEGPGPHLQA
jgi:hypothetical protein